MSLLTRYRDYRDDPYRDFYGARGRWDARLAVGVPLGVALVIVVNFALAAVNPGVAESKFSGAGGAGYRTLLIPSSPAASTVNVDRSTSAHRPSSQTAQRVVTTSKVAVAPSPAGTVTAPAGTTSAPAGSATTGSSAAVSGRSATTYHHHVSYRTDANGYRLAPQRDVDMVPTTTWIAHLEQSTRGYPSSNALSSDRRVPGSWYGYPSILPIIGTSANRLHVRLAQRPDESTSWIDSNDAVITHSHYAILVDISQHWLYVFYDGIQQESFPVGTGAPGTPTPTGEYFLAFHAPPNGPGYGSVMLETSAHSRVIEHFEGGNDAIIAIHGPIDSQSDREIGDHGAAISNGCIRMHNYDLNQVRHIPNGVPIILTD